MRKYLAIYKIALETFNLYVHGRKDAFVRTIVLQLSHWLSAQKSG